MRKRSTPAPSLPKVALCGLAFTLLWLVGCSSTTEPIPTAPGPAQVHGDIDPGASSFLLQSVETELPGGARARIDLVGRNLEVDPSTSLVSLQVALRNRSNQTLFPDVLVWISSLQPNSVTVWNADLIPPGLPPWAGLWGFDYSEHLGEDGVLAPDETSGFKPWIFADPDLLAFSFDAEIEFGMEPPGARIAGIIFWDENHDGVLDPDETGFGAGWVRVTGADMPREAVPDEHGKYSVHVARPGLYHVEYIPPPTFAPLGFSTPNPLEVVLLPSPDGSPQSFLDAHFGVYNLIGPRPVRITDLPPEQIRQDPYRLEALELGGTLLTVAVGYSGCEPGHPLTLYMVGGFQESMPVQTTLLLSHDDRGEECDAAFHDEPVFDLSPIQEAYVEQYGELAPIVVKFRDHDGEVTRFELLPPDVQR